MSLDAYIKWAIAEVELELEQVDWHLSKKVTTPMSHGYRPELDATSELDARCVNCFQGLIGVLWWICELGKWTSCLTLLCFLNTWPARGKGT